MDNVQICGSCSVNQQIAHHLLCPEIAVHWIAPLLGIWMVSISNVELKTGYPILEHLHQAKVKTVHHIHYCRFLLLPSEIIIHNYLALPLSLFPFSFYLPILPFSSDSLVYLPALSAISFFVPYFFRPLFCFHLKKLKKLKPMV
jgi:hypothetical protein